MFRLQVKVKGKWRWGIRQYETIEEANARVEALSKVGIVARVAETTDLYI